MNIIDMLTNHTFWGLLTLTVLVWYSTVTVYVAVRGAFDIKQMLSTLAARKDDDKPPTHGAGG